MVVVAGFMFTVLRKEELSYEVVNVSWSISNWYIESCLGLRESVYEVVFKNYIGLRFNLA